MFGIVDSRFCRGIIPKGIIRLWLRFLNSCFLFLVSCFLFPFNRLNTSPMISKNIENIKKELDSNHAELVVVTKYQNLEDTATAIENGASII